MRIITANLNGIRAAAKKGFFNWLLSQNADVICLQEIKAKPEQLTDTIFYPEGYHHYFNAAEKPGYSGVALFCRHKPDILHTSLGWPHADNEGRYLQADFGNLSIVSLYMPSGSSSEARQTVKFDFLTRYEEILKSRPKEREYIICGDWNIAHKEIDLKNWRSNVKNSGFLPEERAWLTQLFDVYGFVDAFRIINQSPEQYTWWSNRRQSWEKNVGWRIDYHIVTPGLKEAITAANIYKEQKFSDHAPLIIDYNDQLINPLLLRT